MNMDSKRVQIPDQSPISASLDIPQTRPRGVVISCPPHPAFGGHRSDPRLRSVSTHLLEHDLACLRFDYQNLTIPPSKTIDTVIRWVPRNIADPRLPVGLFGYSYGGTVAILSAHSSEHQVLGVVGLAPAGEKESEVRNILESSVQPISLIFADNDRVAYGPFLDLRRDTIEIEVLKSDHSFQGHFDRIGARIAEFFDRLLDTTESG